MPKIFLVHAKKSASHVVVSVLQHPSVPPASLRICSSWLSHDMIYNLHNLPTVLLSAEFLCSSIWSYNCVEARLMCWNIRRTMVGSADQIQFIQPCRIFEFLTKFSARRSQDGWFFRQDLADWFNPKEISLQIKKTLKWSLTGLFLNMLNKDLTHRKIFVMYLRRPKSGS